MFKPIKALFALLLMLALTVPATLTSAAKPRATGEEAYLRQAEQRSQAAQSGNANFTVDFDCSMGKLDVGTDTNYAFASTDPAAAHVYPLLIGGIAHIRTQLPLSQPETLDYPVYLNVTEAATDIYWFQHSKGTWAHYQQTAESLKNSLNTLKGESIKLAALSNSPKAPRKVTLASQTDAVKTLNVELDVRAFFKAFQAAIKDSKRHKDFKLNLKAPEFQTFTYQVEIDRPTQTIRKQTFDMTAVARSLAHQFLLDDKKTTPEDRKFIDQFIDTATLVLYMNYKDYNAPIKIEIPADALATPAKPMTKSDDAGKSANAKQAAKPAKK